MTSGARDHKPEKQADDEAHRSDLLLFNGLFIKSNPAGKRDL